jgi:FkbM family methyltransferase
MPVLMSSPIAKALSLLTAWQRYGNPWSLWLARHLKPHGKLKIIDRVSRVCCKCTTASSWMFGETWHRHDYDVPKVPVRPGDIVLDVGANQGFFTCYAAHRGARVYAFEPFPQSFDTLLENVRANGFEKNVVARACALAGKNGTADLIYSDRLGGGMNTISFTFGQNNQLDPRHQITVPCYTLPQIIMELSLDKIRLCKLDCEGAELEILKRLSEKDLQKIDAFAIEYHREAYSLQELLQLILSWGTHHISFAEDIMFERYVLRAVSSRVLAEEVH